MICEEGEDITHDKLMACLRMRISDRSVLSLIQAWLRASVVEPKQGHPDGKGGSGGGSGGSGRKRQGTPQGGVISPLLANIYLHWFEKPSMDGMARRNGPRLG